MFESITKKRKNPVFNIAGWALLALVCLIFVFVGYSPDVDFMGSASAVASVNGESISYSDYSRYFERVQEGRNQQQKMSPKDRLQLQNEVVDSLVNRELILQAANRQGIVVGDEEIREFLKEIPQFQDNGQFSVLKYKELIRGQGMSEAVFEQKIVEDLLVQKMNGLYTKVSQDDQLVTQQEEAVSKVRMDIDFIKKAKGELVTDGEITADDVQKFIKDKASAISDYYSKNTTEFSQEESAKAQHILIKTSPEVTEEQALAKIKEVAAQLKPDNFDQLAKKFSEDPGSKERGGDLGFFTREKMVPEFSEQAFTVPVGQVSAPFKSQFGYHILKVNARTEKKTAPQSEVQDQIARRLIREERASTVVKTIRDALAGGTTTTAELLAKKGWNWDSTGGFGLGDVMIPKIGEDTEVLAAAMTLNPANPIYKDVIEKGGNYYIVKYKSIDMKAAATKEPNMDIFKQLFERQKSMETFQSWMDHLRKDAKVKINEKILSQN